MSQTLSIVCDSGSWQVPTDIFQGDMDIYRMGAKAVSNPFGQQVLVYGGIHVQPVFLNQSTEFQDGYIFSFDNGNFPEYSFGTCY